MKYITVIFLFTIVIVAWGKIGIAVYNDKSGYEKYIKEGNSYAEDEIYIKALNSYMMALKYDKNNKELEKKIMQVYYQMEDFKSYCNYNLELIKKYPSEIEFYLNLLIYYKKTSEEKLIKFMLTIPEKIQEDEKVKSYFQYAKSLYEIQSLGINNMTDFLFGYSRVEKSVIKENGEKVSTQYLLGIDGTILFDEEDYINISPIGNATQYLIQDKNGIWKIMNELGYVLAQRKDIQFDSIMPFTDNYTSGMINKKPCYITTEFKIADMSEYTSISNFSNGYAAVEKNGMYALMDSQLALISDYQYDDIKKDDFGRAYMNNCFIVKENGQYYFVNDKNEKVSENGFDDAKVFIDSQPTAVCKGERWGFVNSLGEIYIDYQYEDAKPFSNGYAAVKQNGLWGYIDSNGDFVIEPQFKEAGNMTKQGVSLVGLTQKEEKDAESLDTVISTEYALLTYDYLDIQAANKEE